MTDEAWLPARLIPTSGIRGERERETRATSALLSVLGAVDEFGKSILRGRFGAPAGAVETYIEVPLKMLNGTVVRPDGLVRIRRGARTWAALFEVKTGTTELEREQVESYLDAAREHEFDAVVTISNQIVPATGDHPVAVNRRKTPHVRNAQGAPPPGQRIGASGARGEGDREQPERRARVVIAAVFRGRRRRRG